MTREPAVIVYNRDLVSPDEAPRSRFDLIDLLRPAGSRYAGRVATYDIEASGIGYLFAFADSQQATTFGSLSRPSPAPAPSPPAARPRSSTPSPRAAT